MIPFAIIGNKAIHNEDTIIYSQTEDKGGDNDIENVDLNIK